MNLSSDIYLQSTMSSVRLLRTSTFTAAPWFGLMPDTPNTSSPRNLPLTEISEGGACNGDCHEPRFAYVC